MVSAWATKAPDGKLRITLINDDLTHARTIAIKVPGGAGGATLVRLHAPSASATSGITLGGLSFGTRTTTGRPDGREQLEPVAPVRGRYVVKLPPASAVLLVR